MDHNMGITKHIKLMVEMDAPSVAEYEHLDRGAKYRYLTDSNRRKRDEFIDWLRSKQLDQFVLGIGESSFANYLFLETTRNIAGQLRSAPHVEHVSKTEDIPVELMSLEKVSIAKK
jgi:hypothetical protein